MFRNLINNLRLIRKKRIKKAPKVKTLRVPFDKDKKRK